MSQSATNAASAATLVLETSQGQIEIELPDLAPNHVARISELAASVL